MNSARTATAGYPAKVAAFNAGVVKPISIRCSYRVEKSGLLRVGHFVLADAVNVTNATKRTLRLNLSRISWIPNGRPFERNNLGYGRAC